VETEANGGATRLLSETKEIDMPATPFRASPGAFAWLGDALWGFSGKQPVLVPLMVRRGFHEALADTAKVDTRTLTALHKARWRNCRA
jgi:hypothetical protein